MTSDNMFVKPKPVRKKRDYKTIRSCEKLYYWLLAYLDEYEEKKPFNKAVADFAEVVAYDPVVDPPYHDDDESEYHDTSLLTRALLASSTCTETKLINPSLVELAGDAYHFTVSEGWEEVCHRALNLAGLPTDDGLIRRRRKGNDWMLVGSRELLRKFKLKVKVPVPDWVGA
jgi:hypothetical protein